jgi:hypothetical protein
VDNIFFFENVLFSTKSVSIFLRIGEDYNIDDLKGKRTWTDDFFLTIDLNTFCSNVLLTLKIMDFENVALTKIIHIYVIEGTNA